MNPTTTQISGYPVTIQTKDAKDGFRTTISSAEADQPTIDLMLQRATDWSRTLSTGRDNSSVRCFRDGHNIVVEDLSRKATDQDIRLLTQYLQAKTQAASGTGENTGGEPALTG